MIADMYEEEYFISCFQKEGSEPFVYKYFSEITDATLSESMQQQHPDGTNTLERGNILGSTVVSQSPWSAPGQHRRQCLLKMYDKDIHEFKLLETVSFIGVLEYRSVQPDQDS